MSNIPQFGFPKKQGLYDPANEKDSCGVGFVANVKGVPSHQIVLDAIQMLKNMDHRGACGCEANTGDGSGILNDYRDGLLSLAPVLAGWESARRHGECIDVAAFLEA